MERSESVRRKSKLSLIHFSILKSEIKTIEISSFKELKELI